MPDPFLPGLFQMSATEETREFVVLQETLMATAAKISIALLIKAQKKMTIRQPTLISHKHNA